MGGAAESPHRSSSPMKRRASDFEEQQDASMVHGVNGTPDVEMSSGQSEASRPTIDEQIQTVTNLLQEFNASTVDVGDKVYLVSSRWLQRVQSRDSTAKSRPEDVEGPIGPVDNSDIMLGILKDVNNVSHAILRPDIVGEFVYMPESAWQYVLDLYGLVDGQVPISRWAVNTNSEPGGMPNIQYELYPPVITIHRIWSPYNPNPLPASMKAADPKAPVIVMSRCDLFVELVKKMKEVTEIPGYRSIRVWKLLERLPSSAQSLDSESLQLSPPASRESSPTPTAWTKLLVSVQDFTKLERDVDREMIDQKDNSVNKNYNGKSITLDFVGIGLEEHLFLDESVDKDNFVSTYTASTASAVPGKISQPKVPTFAGRGSPTPSGPMTRGRSGKSNRTLGAVGLTNLGNTCYMNSALQCVRNVEELTKYFLTDEASEEINYDNPLGNHGEVALKYGMLLKEMYADNGATSYSPRAFKQTIGRYAPSFSGYGQQDSQEFLGFLLDGLQEDLSRIKKKPYIEKPDSTDEMVGNDELIREMADKVWDITKKRDDSVIADLFTGMYKSTLVCPVCDKVSITFDPFNNLTLQLPIESVWRHEVFYFPLNAQPIRVVVELDKQASLRAVKQFIGKRFEVPYERLFISETWKYKFYKHHHEELKAASDEIMANDEIIVYELECAPTNTTPAKHKTKVTRSILDLNNDADEVPSWDDPMAERMLVPVLHRKPNAARNAYKPWEMAAMPHFIVVTPEEAKNEDVIRRKILEKVATFTTYSACHEEGSMNGAKEAIDPDLVVTSSSDVDSSNDGRVVATSVDGEEDVVDVTMADSQVTPSKSNEETKSNAQRPTSKSRPRWINPDEQVPPELQQMFDLKFYRNSRELIPVGWQTVDEEKDFPFLSSRLARPEYDDVETKPPAYGSINDNSESDISEEDEEIDAVNTRMNDESSEDELALPRPLPIRPAKNSKQSQPSHFNRQASREASEDSGAADAGPLIRLGEGILVDWNGEAYDTLFGTDPDDHLRGVSTFTEIGLFDDPELNAKRAARERRKKKGITLDECLDEFGKEEILSEQDTWYCPRCKEHRRASKKFELWRTPDILVMHLKRFSSSAMRRDKLDVEVDFPLEGLDLTKRVIDHQSGKAEIFDLFAVDDHWGGLGGGHYTAFAKSFVDGLWYEYNDSMVSKANTANIVSKGAYLLFYRRRSDEPLGGPRFKKIVDKFNRSMHDNEDESGEGRRLDGVSSQIGSSSALIGAGATHQVDGSAGEEKNRSLVSQNSAAQGIVDPSTIEGLPKYTEFLANRAAAPVMAQDAIMNEGLHIEDEGFDGGQGSGPGFATINQTWDWSNLNQNNFNTSIGNLSDRSDIAAHESTASEASLRGRLEDFDNAPVEYGDHDDDYVPDNIEVPDMDEDAQAGMIGLHHDLQEQATMGLRYGQHDDDDQPAAEIHLDESDGLYEK